MLGTQRDADGLLDELTALAGADPLSRACTELSYRDTIRYQAAPDAAGLADPGATQAQAGTAPDREPSPGAAVSPSPSSSTGPCPAKPSPRWWATSPGSACQARTRILMFAPWGGAYNLRPARATAFAHRSQLFLLEHEIITGARASAAAKHAAHRWVTNSWESAHPWGSGRVYPNFPDPDLADWGHAYYGGNHPRLRTIKGRYDPDAVFGSRQPLLAR